MTAAVVAAASCGLLVLQREAAGPRPDLVPPGRDPLTMAYLRALVAGHPHDAALRLRLAREQLARGELDDADRTVTALASGTGATREALALSLEVALAAWRAARAGTPERDRAEARALARLASLQDRGTTVDLLTRVAAAARELARPDLAARAEQRAAGIDRERCAAWFGRAARDALSAGDPAGAALARRRAYDCARDRAAARALAIEALDAQIAADRGGDVLAFADHLVARFPDDPAIASRAMAAALAGEDPGRARRFAVRLDELGAADQVVLERLFDLDLAARDLPAALRTAERMVARAPRDPRLRQLAGEVAEWAARPRLGLAHWMWLARRRDAAAREHALHLAHALDDDAAVAELLGAEVARGPLGAAAMTELAGALERLGAADRAAALLERTARHGTDEDAWEQLAAFHERRRDLPAAIAARRELAHRLGTSLPRSLRLARLEWAAGHADAALAELGDWIASAGRGDTEYWQVLAELAWQQESDELAERAYRAIWAHGAIDAIGVERLILLARDAGRTADAIRDGRQGWARFAEPRLLLLAMDDAASAGQWDELARLRAEAMRDEPRFADSLAYWLVCGQLDARRGRLTAAAHDYRRALALDSGSAAARAALLWLLIDGADRAALAGALASWADDAEDDPRLWRAYAVGLERLGRIGEALAFYRREAEADRDDAGARARYLAAVRRSAPEPATQPARPGATVMGAELAVTTLGPAVLRRLGATASTGVRGAALELRAQLTRLSADDPALRLDRGALDVLAGGALDVLGGRAELLGGANLSRDAAILRAAAVYVRALTPRAQLRLDAALHELAPESAILLGEAVRSRAGAALALDRGRLFARAGGEWKTWSSQSPQSGRWLADGGAATLDVGVHARLANPAIDVRAGGGYQRNEVAARMDPPLLPDELVTLGIGASAAGWKLGAARLSVDTWLGEMTPPRRVAYRVQTGLAIEPFAGAQLALAGYVANDSWQIGAGGLGLTASLSYRIPDATR